MQPRRIDGIYARELPRRSDPKRRLLVPPRPAELSTPSPVVATPVPIVDVVRTPVPAPTPKEISSAQLDAASPQPTPTPVTPSRPTKHRRLSLALYAGLIVIVLGVTAALSYSTWRTNEDARAAFAQDTPTGQSSTDSSSTSEDTPPSEAEVTETTKKAYTVAADMPRMVHIDRIGVHARVLRMSVTASGAIQAPSNIWDTGWYDGSAKPGEAGTTFIDGHISGPTMPAVFAKLKVLHAGDFVTIERGDSSTITYVVKTVNTNKVKDIDMKQVLAAPANGAQQLTLMTCGGNYQGNFTYDSRVIVVAEKV